MFLSFPIWLWIILGSMFFVLIVNVLRELHLWFPNTTREMLDERIAELENTDRKLDRYILEMEKRVLGIFK